jgi:hypothetical protein
MTRIRTVSICLLAAFVSSAVAAASASALPEFSGPFPKAFTSTSKTTILETVGKTKVKCAADTSTGEITGPTAGIAMLRLTGCESKTFPCNSPGAAAGEIVTHPLSITVGYINRELKEVGLDLANPAGALLAEFQCVNLVAVMRGSVIGKITPVNKLVKPGAHFSLKFAQKAGAQKIVKFAGGPVDILETSFNGGPFEPSGLGSTDVVSFKEPVLLKA